MNIKVFKACVNHRLYFRYLPKNTLKKTWDKGSGSANMLTNFQDFLVFSYCSVMLHYTPPLSETLCFSSCHFKAHSALIGQLTHAWTNITHNNRAAELNQCLRYKKNAMCNSVCVMRCHKVIKSKARLLTMHFNFPDFLRAQEHL